MRKKKGSFFAKNFEIGVVDLGHTTAMNGKSVLALADFSPEEITEVLTTAREMRRIIDGGHKKKPLLNGKSIVTLFYEPSTRTRTSFELAGKYLGADVVNIAVNASSIVKGESLRDTLYTIEAMGVDGIVLRHKAEGAAAYADKISSAVIFNAGDGAHAHPSQGLLNLYTILDKKERLAGLKVAIIGDIVHSRVARSDIEAMRKMGMKVHLFAPPTLLPRFLTAGHGLFIHDRLEDALAAADVVEVLRIQLERMKGGLFPSTREYARLFGINEMRLKLCAADVLVLHPGPMNKGWEISPVVAYGDNSAIQEEVKNGVAVRMALYALTMGGGQK